MERFAQLLDELEDILSLLRHQLGLFPARRNKPKGTVPFNATASR